MDKEELKKKIEYILAEYNFETDNGEGWVLSTDEMADDLIAAGLNFADEFEKRANLLLTACNFFEEKWKESERRVKILEMVLRDLARFCANGARYYSNGKEELNPREQEIYNEWIAEGERQFAEEKGEKNG